MKEFALYVIILSSFLNGLRAQQSNWLDPNFGIDGKVTTDVSPLAVTSFLRDVLLLPDEKLIGIGGLGSNVGSNNLDLIMVKYNSNGTLDNTFGYQGIQIHDLLPGEDHSDYFRKAALQPDGKIVCTGAIQSGNAKYVMVSRFLPNGNLDNTFGNGGFTTYSYNSQIEFEGISLAIQTDGKIVIGCRAVPLDTGLVIRYQQDGIIDYTFGVNGICPVNYALETIILDQNDYIYVAGDIGNTWPVFSTDAAISRLYGNGTIDSTYGENGLARFNYTSQLGSSYQFTKSYAISLQPNGNILVGGYSQSTSNDSKFALASINQNGVLDSSFADNGKRIVDMPGTFERITSVTILSDGKIYCAGNEINASYNFALARITPNGDLDLTFNNTGILSIDMHGYNDICFASALQQDNKLIVAGTTHISEFDYPDFGLVRVLYDLSQSSNSLLKNSQTIIYPNPITSTPIFEYFLDSEEQINVELYDPNGKWAYTFINNETRLSGRNQETLVFPQSLAHGVYFLKFTSAGRNEIIKVIK